MNRKETGRDGRGEWRIKIRIEKRIKKCSIVE